MAWYGMVYGMVYCDGGGGRYRSVWYGMVWCGVLRCRSGPRWIVELYACIYKSCMEVCMYVCMYMYVDAHIQLDARIQSGVCI